MKAAEDTISPSQDQDVAAAATPLQYASLIVQMLAAFAAAGERSQRVSTARDQR